MPEYTLIYFDLRAIAEPIRLIFAFAKVPYKDQRISSEEWSKIKPTLSMGKVPVLIEDNRELTQSQTIARYLAKKFNLMPENDFDAARCDQVVDMLYDIVNLKWRPFLLEENLQQKAKLKDCLLQDFLPASLKQFEKFLKLNGNLHIAGTKISWADLMLAHFLETFELSIDLNLLRDYPILKEFKENLFKIPEIKQWVDKRPKFTIA